MKAAGYKKDGATWRKADDVAIAVLNIQGSQFGATLFINLGIYFLALGTSVRPFEYDCHLRTRLTRMVPDPMRLTQLLDFSGVYGSIPNDSRYREIVLTVEQYALPWLVRCSTPGGARDEIENGMGMVAAELRAHLGCHQH